MLLKSSSGNMPFRKVLIIRIWVSAFLALVGFKCLLLVLLNQVGDLESLTSKFGVYLINLSFMEGFYTGFGGSLIAAGIVLIIRNSILLRNEEKLKKAEIDYLDERNRFIRNATFSATSYIFFIVLAFAVVISGMFNSVVFVTLLGTFFVYLIIYVVTSLICKAKY